MVAKPQLMLINWIVCVAGCMIILLYSTFFNFFHSEVVDTIDDCNAGGIFRHCRLFGY
jgi:hypothetical protein